MIFSVCSPGGVYALLTLEEEQKQALVNERPCGLIQQEFSLLLVLAHHINQPVSREMLLQGAWGYSIPGIPVQWTCISSG